MLNFFQKNYRIEYLKLFLANNITFYLQNPFPMLRRKKKNSNKRIRILIVALVLILLIIRVFTSNTENSATNLSGESESGTMELLPAEAALLNETPLTEIISGDLQSSGITIAETATGETSDLPATETPQSTTETTPAETIGKKTDLFPVDLCNRIVNLYECIIQHAPIENQPTMQENLKKATAQRALLASPQLTEVCQAISKDETFILVRSHYMGWAFACTF